MQEEPPTVKVVGSLVPPVCVPLKPIVVEPPGASVEFHDSGSRSPPGRTATTSPTNPEA